MIIKSFACCGRQGPSLDLDTKSAGGCITARLGSVSSVSQSSPLPNPCALHVLLFFVPFTRCPKTPTTIMMFALSSMVTYDWLPLITLYLTF